MLLDQAGHLVASLRLETVEVWVSCEVLTLWLSLSLTLSSHTGNPNMIWYKWKIMIPERRNHQFTLLIFRRPCFSNAYFTFKTIWMKIAEFLAKFQTLRLGGLCARVPHHPNTANFLRNFALKTSSTECFKKNVTLTKLSISFLISAFTPKIYLCTLRVTPLNLFDTIRFETFQ